MAKRLSINEDDVSAFIAEMAKYVGHRCLTGAFSVKKAFAKDNRRCVVAFTETAWLKVQALVANFNTEVQWHGLVRRVAPDEFEVYDIITFPHEVTAATVVTEYEPYIKWRFDLRDEVFNNEHFHGHSHVEMATSPSQTDMKYRTDLVTQMPNGFYIFMIFNKKGSIEAQVYDIDNDVVYDNDEVDIDVNIGDTSLSDFIAEAKSKVTAPAPATTAVYPTYSGNGCSTSNTKKAKSKEKKNVYTHPEDDDDWYDDYWGRWR